MKTPLLQKVALIGLGIFLCLFFIELLLRLVGGLFLLRQENRNLQSLKKKGEYRILCLGESTTALGGTISYPEQLESILNESGLGIKFSVINKGIPGTSTKFILEQVEKYLNKYHPDMVITMMGINDYDHGYSMINMDTRGISDENSFIGGLRIVKMTEFVAGRLSAFVSSIKNKKRVNEKKSVFDQYDVSDNRRNKSQNCRQYSVTVQRYMKLAGAYVSRGKHREAEAAYRKLIKLEPNNYDFYLNLGWILLTQEKFEQAEQAQLKAIDIDPDADAAYNAAGFLYLNQSNYAQAERMFKKAIAINPANHKSYVDLGQCYILQGQYQQAIEVYKLGIAEDLRNDRAYGGLAVIYNILGDSQKASSYFDKADKAREAFFLPATVASYRKLAGILENRSTKFLCMQYPMRSVLPLKIILNDYPDVIFVDNERIFKSAVEKEGCKNYFCDLFAGDFGHCTEKGNKLIAGNAAKVIFKEMFH